MVVDNTGERKTSRRFFHGVPQKVGAIRLNSCQTIADHQRTGRGSRRSSEKSVFSVSEPSKSEPKRGLPDLGNPRIFLSEPMRADAVRSP